MAVASDTQTRRRRSARAASRSNGRQAKDGTVEISRKDLKELVDALRSARDGELSVRLSEKSGAMGDVAKAYNQLADRREGLTRELGRVSKVIGREGRMTERAQLRGAKGSWAGAIGSVNSMIEDLVRPTIEVGRAYMASQSQILLKVVFPALARVEAKAAFERLLGQSRPLRLAGEAAWRPGINLRSLAQLPVAFRP